MEKLHYKLPVQGIVSEDSYKLVSKGLIRSLDEPFVVNLFCSYSEYDIPIGAKFDSLINLSSGENLEIDATLIDITQAWGLRYDFVPLGHKTISQFEVSESDLLIVKKTLPVIESWSLSDSIFELIKHVIR